MADLEAVERIAPAGHRPSDLMPRVKSVIAVGVGGSTAGAWRVPAKALSYFGSTESRAYKIVYGLAFYIEQKFGVPSIYCPPDMDPELGARYPLQSLKLHAELAGLGARSLAGDILLHPDYGYMYYASCFTELALPPDKPLAENPCPAPSCVNMFRREGRTPCMKFCPAQCLSGEIDADGKQASMHYDMAACAELTQQFETVPQLLRDAIATDNPEEREALLLGERNKVLVVPDDGRQRRAVRAMFRMHARLSGCDQCAACGSAQARRGASRYCVAKGGQWRRQRGVSGSASRMR